MTDPAAKQPACLSTEEAISPYYQHNGISLYHGDCREVMPQLPSGSIGMILTDLPYAMTDCAWDSQVPLSSLWPEWKRLLMPNRAIILTASQPFTSVLVMSQFNAFKCEWIWKKNAGSNFGVVKFQPMKEHESVLVFGWGSELYKPIMEERAASGLSRVQHIVNYNTRAEVYSSGGLIGQASSKRPDLRYPSSVQNFNRERGLHPTQKPVDLMAYMIKTYSNEGDIVLDCCAGSGTTLVAAQQTGRRAIGIEISEEYCQVTASRLEKPKQGTLQESFNV